MSGQLKLRLADGGEIEATFDDELPGSLRDVLATGYVGNQMKIAMEDTSEVEDSDVEGHSLPATIKVRLFDEDDVEGHAMTLHLPNAQSARDLQKRLLAAGVVGVIVVGAAATAVWAPGDSTGAATGQSTSIAAPAPPPISPALKAEIANGEAATIGAPTAPAISPAMRAELATGESVVVSVPNAPAISPALKAELAAGESATIGAPTAPAISPAMRAELAGGDAGSAAPADPAVSPGLKADLANGDVQP
jgi:hypothetical protein